MAQIERKLTTIMAADVAGYSALMERNEEQTLETLRGHRATMRGFIERHRGRIANTAGDSVMAEFPSVLEAVTAAAEIQQELGARNAALPSDRQMEFRIGINIGDVMVEGDDLFGEGVNIAARLESLAEPGGICISGTVYDQVKNKLTLEYDFMGAQRVKNISDEIPVYRVETGGLLTDTEPPSEQTDTPAEDGGDLSQTLGSLGEKLGKIIEERVDDDELKVRIADGFDSGKLGDVLRERIEEKVEERIEERTGRPQVAVIAPSFVRSLALLALLAVIDAFVSEGWWVQWPAIILIGIHSISYAKGIWKLAAIAAVALAVDWANGDGWWAHWVAGGVGVVIALRYISRLGRSGRS